MHGMWPSTARMGTSSALGRAATVLVVDDHPMMRRAMVELINGAPDLAVFDEAGSSGEALALLGPDLPDLVLLDVAMPGPNGIELLKQLRQRSRALRVLVFSVYDEHVWAPLALTNGADGYLTKAATPEEVLAAIRRVLRGEPVVSPAISRCTRRTPEGRKLARAISDREMEIIERLGQGLSNKQIAAALHLSIKTVHTHLANLRRKLGLESNHQLIEWAVVQRINGGRIERGTN